MKQSLCQTNWMNLGRPLYDVYFEVANLRLGRGGEKPLE